MLLSMSKVTVIIPTHGRPDLLPRAVASAHAASTDIEVIVVDDASTDHTASVCDGLSGIRYIRLERNQGVAGARNVGLLESTGKYVTFLDDDDLRLPGSIDLQVQALEENPAAGFVCGAMIMADQNYQPTGEVSFPRHRGGDVFWDLLELDFPVMPLSTLIRKECFLRVGLLNQHLRGIDDWDIFVRIAERHPVVVMDTPVGLYRCPTPSAAQGSSDRAAQLRGAARQLTQLLKLPRAQAATPGQRRAVRRRANNRLADTLLWNAARQFAGGELGAAYRNILGALRINPLRAIRPRAYKNLAGRLLLNRSVIQT